VNHFDAVIIGAGQAGPPLAARLTAAGMTVGLVERNLFGGTCVNTGCMPTKTLIATARAAHVARHAGALGVIASASVRVDLTRAKARADAITEESRTGIERRLRAMKGCTVLSGHARFEAPHVVRVGSETLTAPRIFVNVGGRAAIPNMPGVDRTSYLTNSSILKLTEIPSHLVIVGGSYVGLEFGQMYRRFGAEVTIVERDARLISREDPEISEAIRDVLLGEGITVRTRADCIRLAPHASGVSVGVQCAEGPPEIVSSHVLLAVGRKPNTDDLGLDVAGIATDARGYVVVGDDLATNVPGVWALGECNGHGAFTHTAYNDFEIVAANLLDGEQRKVSARVPAYALYTDPPLGRVGLTTTQALATGRPLLTAALPMTRVSRAVEKGETKGLMKVVADAATQEILGAAVLGTGGDEVIHCLIDAMNARLKYTSLVWAVPIHPTVSELIPTLLRELRPNVRSGTT
jgi:pyruvate/2-oxoglutarate dehydrogenase complex dihydrolipoamide dehydrogenase (E3) component